MSPSTQMFVAIIVICVGLGTALGASILAMLNR